VLKNPKSKRAFLCHLTTATRMEHVLSPSLTPQQLNLFPVHHTLLKVALHACNMAYIGVASRRWSSDTATCQRKSSRADRARRTQRKRRTSPRGRGPTMYCLNKGQLTFCLFYMPSNLLIQLQGAFSSGGTERGARGGRGRGENRARGSRSRQVVPCTLY
jgi:hypothetical protein